MNSAASTDRPSADAVPEAMDAIVRAVDQALGEPEALVLDADVALATLFTDVPDDLIFLPPKGKLPPPRRTAPRARGAGRPAARRTSRSTSRGDPDPGEPEPAPRPPGAPS